MIMNISSFFKYLTTKTFDEPNGKSRKKKNILSQKNIIVTLLNQLDQDYSCSSCFILVGFDLRIYVSIFIK